MTPGNGHRKRHQRQQQQGDGDHTRADARDAAPANGRRGHAHDDADAPITLLRTIWSGAYPIGGSRGVSALSPRGSAEAATARIS